MSLGQGKDQQDIAGAWWSQLAKKPDVEDVWFNNKVVRLDGYTFRSCRFDNCRLEIASPNFEMHRCIIDPTTVISYVGQAVKLLRLYNSRDEKAYRTQPSFAPKKHDDGTISIVL